MAQEAKKDFSKRADPSPTAEAEKALRQWGVIFSKQDDGTLRVDGDIIIRNQQLKSLPDLSMVVVVGDFICSQNQLTSLKGAPQKVFGDFLCSNNLLTTLEGAPRNVGGSFLCSENKLQDLTGAPEIVGGNFWCSLNGLTSLKGAPKQIRQDFSCAHNLLTSLEYAPQNVGRDFHCEDNKLESLRGAPPSIQGKFWCKRNFLAYLEDAPHKFQELISDIGTFSSWEKVPENLQVSPETKARKEKERAELKARGKSGAPLKKAIPKSTQLSVKKQPRPKK